MSGPPDGRGAPRPRPAWHWPTTAIALVGIAYAVLGRRSTWVTMGMLFVAIGLTIFSSSWLVWTLLLILMLFIVGPHHPPTLNDRIPLDRSRLLLAAFAVVMLILCFTPAPIEPFVTGGR